MSSPELWYGTPDSPAPSGIVSGEQAVNVIAGVAPAHPTNVVRLRYRVNGGIEQTSQARLLRTDHANDNQYFEARFPYLPPGAKVDYALVCIRGGRQIPSPGDTTLPYHFEVSASPLDTKARSKESDIPRNRFELVPDYIARFTIYLASAGPEAVGETPEGLRLNWYPASGNVVGPKLNAKIRPVGGDWMTIRPDGVGIIDVRGTLETPEGALIYASYTGVFELGIDGYANALNGKWPEKPASRTAPRFLTSHPSYIWLNRLQCVAVGNVLMKELVYEYDLYSV